MDDLSRVLIFFLVAIYFLSPIDAFPGPIDDIIVMYLGMQANKRIKARK